VNCACCGAWPFVIISWVNVGIFHNAITEQTFYCDNSGETSLDDVMTNAVFLRSPLEINGDIYVKKIWAEIGYGFIELVFVKNLV
jgi:hypothetical protein